MTSCCHGQQGRLWGAGLTKCECDREREREQEDFPKCYFNGNFEVLLAEGWILFDIFKSISSFIDTFDWTRNIQRDGTESHKPGCLTLLDYKMSDIGPVFLDIFFLASLKGHFSVFQLNPGKRNRGDL